MVALVSFLLYLTTLVCVCYIARVRIGASRGTGFRLDATGSITGTGKDFPSSLWVHPGSCQVNSFSGNKAAGVRSWPLTPIHHSCRQYAELYLHSPIRLYRVVFKRPNFTLLLNCMAYNDAAYGRSGLSKR